MSVLKFVSVTARFANTYDSQRSISIDKDYRVKAGFKFNTTVEDNSRYLIETVIGDQQNLMGRWISKTLCTVVSEEEIDVSSEINYPYEGEVCDITFKVLGPIQIAKSLRQTPKTFDILQPRSLIVSEFKTSIVVNGNLQTRYLIQDCDVSELVGQWLILDKNLSIEWNGTRVGINVEDALPDTIDIAGLKVSDELAATSYSGGLTSGILNGTSASSTSNTYPGMLVKGPTASTTKTNRTNYVPQNTMATVLSATSGNVTGVANTETVMTSGSVKWTLYTFNDGAKMIHKVDTGGTLNEWEAASSTDTVASIRKKHGWIVDSSGSVDLAAMADEKASESNSTTDNGFVFVDSSQGDEFGGGSYAYTKISGSNSDIVKKLYDIYELEYPEQSLMSIPLDRMNFVHGMPFQFSPIADRRRGAKNGTETPGVTDSYGLVFAREVLAQVPIVVFAPGRPQFLSRLKAGFFGHKGANTSIKDMWMPLFHGADGTVESALMSIVQDGGEYDYYTMNIDTADYYNYVNMICKTSARNMGLTSPLPIAGTGNKIPMHLDWSKYNVDVDINCKQDSIMSVLGMNSGVAFAFDPQSSITDSLSTSTTESQLTGMLNQLSSTSRELAFVMGQATEGNVTFGQLDESDWNQVAQSYQEASSNGKHPVIDSISRYWNNISNGLNIRFPEIWQDSTQTKSYSVDMHFVSPYAAAVSVWRHVLVPFWHIFVLAAPQSMKKIGSYDSPFLIRAFSKGYFNVEMGIIESLSYKRFGDGDMITANGIPTQIDVSVDFKDMYHVLAISPYAPRNMQLFFNNAGLLDLIGTLSGVNMNRLGLSERISLYVYAGVESIRSMGSNFMNHVRDRTRNVIDAFYFGI